MSPRRYIYAHGSTDSAGTMRCATCGKQVGSEWFRYYQKWQHHDWHYVCHCRDCSAGDPGWEKHDQALAAAAAREREYSADLAAFEAKWGARP